MGNANYIRNENDDANQGLLQMHLSSSSLAAEREVPGEFVRHLVLAACGTVCWRVCACLGSLWTEKGDFILLSSLALG